MKKNSLVFFFFFFFFFFFLVFFFVRVKEKGRVRGLGHPKQKYGLIADGNKNDKKFNE